MKKKLETEVARMEETQEALRESIEATRLLAEKADRLVQQHKDTLAKDWPGD